MSATAQIRIKPSKRERTGNFEQILEGITLSNSDVRRLQACTRQEQLARALYHRRRYLRYVTEDDIRLRIGYLIANAAYVSERKRYSTNNLYSRYWQTRLAHATEALAIRNSTSDISSEVVLRHLPSLRFTTPAEKGLKHDTKSNCLFRYDKLRYLRRLQELGKILLRCGSTSDPTNNFARNDPNELCIRLRLLAEGLDIEFSSELSQMADNKDSFDIQIHHQTDFFMFCLSEVYDWRLLGDFGAGFDSENPDESVGCLVITDPDQFRDRFLCGATKFLSRRASEFKHPFEISAGRALYYDPYDPAECAPLFENPLVLPFAKRREFTYQHEFRFVIRPDLPTDFVPTYAPADIPRFGRDFLHLGDLRDISYIVPKGVSARDEQSHYLASKDVHFLAAAMGVTLANSGEKLRFTYSVEVKEKGRVSTPNLMRSRRFNGGSLQLHEQEIDIVLSTDRCDISVALRDFYATFDIREQGNHLMQFQAHLHPQGTSICGYRAYLACAEPSDERIEASRVAFRFRSSYIDNEGREVSSSELIEIDGYTYLANVSGTGPLRRYPTYRSLLSAEMKFIQRMIENRVKKLHSYECVSQELGERLSAFSVA